MAQKPPVPESGFKNASDMFNSGNFRGALDLYRNLYKPDTVNTELNYKIGFCYMNLNDDKSKGIPFLEFTVQQNKYPADAWFYLGIGYQYSLRFDKAIEAFGKYLQKSDDKNRAVAERQVEMCNNGKQLVKYPVPVTFENLGSEINSPYPDYNPVVPEDESFLIYSSRRKGNIGNFIDDNSYFTSDIYISTVKSGKFTKAKNMSGGINTEMDEESLGLTADGNNLLLLIDDIDIYSDIYLSARKGGVYL
ncbi:MAG: tetratricopeptide repeat protein [Bacteroidetes bacterium]|nr:tetratricopeptide repeat protein [Bacteroidota bacterium]